MPKADYSRHQLRDEDVPQLDTLLEEFDKGRGISQIDFSNNKISGASLEWMLMPTRNLYALRVVKLHRNRLEDHAMHFLAEVIRGCPELAELHLSHNQLTAVGAKELVRPACDRRYRNALLWMRLEQNYIQSPQRMLDHWKQKGLQLCDSDNSSCTKDNCPYGALLHLPYFRLQRVEGEEAANNEDYGQRSHNHRGQQTSYSSHSHGYGSSSASQRHRQYDNWNSSSYGGSSWSAGYQDKSWSGSDYWHSSSGGAASGSRDRRPTASSRGSRDGAGGTGKFPVAVRGVRALQFSELHITDQDLVGPTFRALETSFDWKDLERIKDLDLSKNYINGVGLHRVVDFCTSLVSLRIVKLYKCEIGDVGATSLVELLWRCPLNELHLSHNMLSDRGVAKLVPAACGSRAEDKKNSSAREQPPLWLRLEYNTVEEPRELLRKWCESGLSVCGAFKGCSSTYCKYGKDVHLPFFVNQRTYDESIGAARWDPEASGRPVKEKSSEKTSSEKTEKKSSQAKKEKEKDKESSGGKWVVKVSDGKAEAEAEEKDEQEDAADDDNKRAARCDWTAGEEEPTVFSEGES
eukprot:TRINITY_DN31558_c0_g1_i1.p1 TRINITY_DN31558_c0_g1~~TRINITY_DN31558_c0_g1_i1.p1  ORF type:complete len:577 (-),score=164.60 TRINITY_DN31558_c0_g1_i1:213-1943(-)